MNERREDSSFLKRKQVVIDGDVESNPGPVDSVDNTPKSKGRPKGTLKKKGFKILTIRQKKYIILQ